MNSQLAHRSRRSEGGYVLVAAAAIVVVLLGTGLAFMRWSTDEAMQSEHASGAIEAYYLGQMGVVEQGFQWLRNRQEGDLPVSEVTLPGRAVPGFGRYSDVRVNPLSSGPDGDFWTQTKWYRITAIGITAVPWYADGQDQVKEIQRRAVLYVKVRNFVDYMYLSDIEITTFGDIIRFWHGDTLNGRVHSNWQIAIMNDPVFYEQVTQAGHWDDFEHGAGYNPQFLGPPPIFHAQPVLIPEVAENLRAHANHFENPGFNKQQRMVIIGSTAHVYTWDRGEAFDSLTALETNFPITNNTCFFTEAPLELMGTDITGHITIGSAQLVRLMDDVRVGGPTSGPPQYRVLPTNENYVGIVSEGDIKIANTPRNGRNNSNGMGNAQTDPDFSDIVITAAVVALGHTDVNGSAGSFTFENQNDPDSGYVGPSPDDRGQIFLYGSVTQRRRGYVHRSNNGSTGYLKQYVYDKRFLKQRPPCFFSAVDTTGRALFDFVQWGEGFDFHTTSQPVRVRYN
jgi:hypothetical protein